MGIYDRDYYRNEGPSFLGSYVGTGRMCMILVLVNVFIYLAQLATRPDRVTAPVFKNNELVGKAELPRGYGPVTEWLAMKPVETFQKLQLWRLVTGAFLHSPDSFWHIVWNMLFLWWFGSELEQMYGSREFLAFYLVSAVLGGLAFVLAQLAGLGGFAAAVGASGAVTAVMVLYAIHFPTRTILLFFILPVPVWLVVVANVAMDSYVFVSGVQTGVAVAVHLGGAAFALAYSKLQLRLLNFVPDFRAWRARRSRRSAGCGARRCFR